MNSPTTPTTVRRSVTVDAARERAFYVFTASMATWWPGSHHIAKTPMADIVLEPRSGGRWYEVDAEGRECEWGTVLEYDFPERVVLGWHLDPDFEYDPDPAMATQVEVRFIADGDSRTRVELEHRGFEVYGDSGRLMADRVSAEGGWGLLLEKFAEKFE
ncbi:MAG TPA: SRPBCC family protein [Thermoleophilaceae bacterium]